MSIADESLQSTSQRQNDLETSGSAEHITSRELTSFVEDSLAKMSPRPRHVTNEALTAGGVVFGRNFIGSFASYDRDSSSWKTSQACLTGELTAFLETWPKSGMTRNGTAYQLAPLVPLTSESGFGYLPTPQASDWFDATVEMNLKVIHMKENGGERPSGAKIGSSLRWCREFVTEQMRTGGELNPEWREVLMGFPIGWTELSPPEMPSSRKSRNGSVGGSSKQNK